MAEAAVCRVGTLAARAAGRSAATGRGRGSGNSAAPTAAPAASNSAEVRLAMDQLNWALSQSASSRPHSAVVQSGVPESKHPALSRQLLLLRLLRAVAPKGEAVSAAQLAEAFEQLRPLLRARGAPSDASVTGETPALCRRGTVAALWQRAGQGNVQRLLDQLCPSPDGGAEGGAAAGGAAAGGASSRLKSGRGGDGSWSVVGAQLVEASHASDGRVAAFAHTPTPGVPGQPPPPSQARAAATGLHQGPPHHQQSRLTEIVEGPFDAHGSGERGLRAPPAASLPQAMRNVPCATPVPLPSRLDTMLIPASVCTHLTVPSPCPLPSPYPLTLPHPTPSP